MLFALVFALSSLTARAQELPKLTEPVNDFAGVIDQSNAATMDHAIRALQQATGDVVTVVTIQTFAPFGDIREYAVKLFENSGRGIGEKGKDNGLLVLLAVKDRKVWIEVGYGLEEFVTDGYSGETSREFMAPEFREGRYGAGLQAGVLRLVNRIAQARHVNLADVPEPRPASRRSSGSFPVWLIILFVLIALASTLGGGGSGFGGRGYGRRWGGGGWSGWNSGIGSFGGGGGGGFGGGFGASVGAAAAVEAAAPVGSCLRRMTMRQVNSWRARVLLTAVVAVLALPLSGCSYNNFVSLDVGVNAQWAQVENQLQRRNDLIPNLVNTVKGYASHEEGVFKAIADSRAKLAGAKTPEDTINAANEQSAALSRLLVVVENYPNLKANEQFNRLTDELSGTENRIAVARMRYNEKVQEYNTLRRKFPSNITATLFGFKEHPFFKAPEAAQQVPKVDFGK